MKIKQIFAVLAVSASLMSCNFLDEFDPNATTAGNFYTSEADIENLAQQGFISRSRRATTTSTTTISPTCGHT